MTHPMNNQAGEISEPKGEKAVESEGAESFQLEGNIYSAAESGLAATDR